MDQEASVFEMLKPLSYDSFGDILPLILIFRIPENETIPKALLLLKLPRLAVPSFSFQTLSLTLLIAVNPV